MRVVPDTNTLVSGLIWSGSPRQMLDQGFAAGWRFFTSAILLAELNRVLRYDRLGKSIRQREQSPEVLFSIARSVLEEIPASTLSTPVSRDPDDDHVLACAVSAQANLIVSGDKDLLVLGQYQGIPIVTVAQALARARTA